MAVPEVAEAARLYWPAHDTSAAAPRPIPAMNAEFNWWLLIVGLVLGASLTWLVMADLARRDADVDEVEAASEVRWIATILNDSGLPISPERVSDVLRLHRDYLAAPPPDDPESAEPAAADDASVAASLEGQSRGTRPV